MARGRSHAGNQTQKWTARRRFGSHGEPCALAFAAFAAQDRLREEYWIYRAEHNSGAQRLEAIDALGSNAGCGTALVARPSR